MVLQCCLKPIKGSFGHAGGPSGSTPPQLEHAPPQLMYFQLSLPFKCKRPWSIPFSRDMADMMVPLATDLCLLALQKSVTTMVKSSLILKFRIASQVDWIRYVPVPLLDARVAADAVLLLASSSFSGFESWRVSTK